MIRQYDWEPGASFRSPCILPFFSFQPVVFSCRLCLPPPFIALPQLTLAFPRNIDYQHKIIEKQ